MNTIPDQSKQFRKDAFDEQGNPITVIATVRHDDQCKNGHNSFSITGELYEKNGSRSDGKVTHKSGVKLGMSCCGCIHDEIEKHFPDLAPLIKWHLTSTDGPMHYIANTVYHVQERKLDLARSSAVWPEATDEELLTLQKQGTLSVRLKERLPALMEQFKADVLSLGFTY